MAPDSLMSLVLFFFTRTRTAGHESHFLRAPGRPATSRVFLTRSRPASHESCFLLRAAGRPATSLDFFYAQRAGRATSLVFLCAQCILCFSIKITFFVLISLYVFIKMVNAFTRFAHSNFGTVSVRLKNEYR